jgi:hypothetical protein
MKYENKLLLKFSLCPEQLQYCKLYIKLYSVFLLLFCEMCAEVLVKERSINFITSVLVTLDYAAILVVLRRIFFFC